MCSGGRSNRQARNKHLILLKEEVMGKARQDRERVEAAAEDGAKGALPIRKTSLTGVS